MSATKSAWAALAVDLAGEWNLCADCQPDAGPKKLFRQTNYWRTVLSLGLTLDPAILGSGGVDANLNLFYRTGATGGGPRATMSTGLTGLDMMACASIGLSMGNPIVAVNDGTTNIEWFAGPVYDWIAQVVTTVCEMPALGHDSVGNVAVCYFGDDGTPGPRSSSLCDLGNY